MASVPPVPPEVLFVECDKGQDPPVINVTLFYPLYGGVPFTLDQRQYETLRSVLGLPLNPCND